MTGLLDPGSFVGGSKNGASVPGFGDILSGVMNRMNKSITPGVAQTVQQAIMGAGGRGPDWPAIQRMLGLTNEEMQSLYGTINSFSNGGNQPPGSDPNQPPGSGGDDFTKVGDDGRNYNWWDDFKHPNTNGTYLGTGGNQPPPPGGYHPPGSTNGPDGPGGPPANPPNPFNPGGNINPPVINPPGGPGGNQPNNSWGPPRVFSPNGPGRVQNPRDALNNYYKTPGYQLLFGKDATNRFQESPGYQFAVDENMKQIQRGAAAKGLLESGSVMREMGDRSQQLANQEYNNWQNMQAQQYGDYQNRLAGLAGGPTGSQNAMNLGQSLGQGAWQTGGNIGDVLGYLASSGLGGILNTGAAYANNWLNAGANQLPSGGNTRQPGIGGILR